MDLDAWLERTGRQDVSCSNILKALVPQPDDRAARQALRDELLRDLERRLARRARTHAGRQPGGVTLPERLPHQSLLTFDGSEMIPGFERVRQPRSRAGPMSGGVLPRPRRRPSGLSRFSGPSEMRVS